MNIEKLKYEELEEYKNLIDNCFGGSNDIGYYKTNYKENNNYEIIVAKIDNKIVGSITFVRLDLFTFSFQPMLEIFNVAVLTEYRGQKIAKTIFQYILDFAKENKYKSIVLTCLNDAYDAHRLYESVGFSKTSSVKYKLDI